MGLLGSMKRWLGRGPTSTKSGVTQDVQAADAGAKQEMNELHVPEVTPKELLDELKDGTGPRPVLLDCREPFERAQSFIPDSIHIPMNAIPHRLKDLDPGQEWVIYCAHGNRSYGVAGWLIQQGYRARSLKGGIADWEHQHGPVEGGYRTRS